MILGASHFIARGVQFFLEKKLYSDILRTKIVPSYTETNVLCTKWGKCTRAGSIWMAGVQVQFIEVNLSKMF